MHRHREGGNGCVSSGAGDGGEGGGVKPCVAYSGADGSSVPKRRIGASRGGGEGHGGAKSIRSVSAATVSDPLSFVSERSSCGAVGRHGTSCIWARALQEIGSRDGKFLPSKTACKAASQRKSRPCGTPRLKIGAAFTQRRECSLRHFRGHPDWVHLLPVSMKDSRTPSS